MGASHLERNERSHKSRSRENSMQAFGRRHQESACARHLRHTRARSFAPLTMKRNHRIFCNHIPRFSAIRIVVESAHAYRRAVLENSGVPVRPACGKKEARLACAAGPGATEWKRELQSTVYFRRAPTGTSSRNPASTGLPSPREAATIMPFDSRPRSLRGCRLATITTLRPTSDSGA